MAHHKKLFGMSPEAGRWILVITGFIINLCLGCVYGYSIFLKPIKDSFEISATMANMPFMFFLAFFSIFMFLTGKVMAKYGPKKIAIFGGILVGLGWALSYFASEQRNIYLLILTYGIIAGGGVGIVYGAPINIIGQWFPDKKGLITGLILAGFGGSPIVTGMAANALIPSVGLSATFLYFGIVFGIVLFFFALPYKLPEPGWKPKGWTPTATATSSVDYEPSEMIKTPTFYGLLFSFLIGCLSGLMVIGISKPVGSEIIKITPELATLFVAVFATFNAVGRPFFGWLTDKITPRGAAIFNLLILSAASAMMLLAKEGDVVLFAVAFSGFWFAYGGWLAIAPTATLQFFGLKNYARNYGIVFFSFGLGALLGGIISGQAKDVFGSYQFAFWPTLGLALIGLVIASLLLKPPVKK